SEKISYADESDSVGHVPSEKHPMCHHRMTVYSRESYARAGPLRSCSLWEGSGSPEHLRPTGARPNLARNRAWRGESGCPTKRPVINEEGEATATWSLWHTLCSEATDNDTDDFFRLDRRPARSIAQLPDRLHPRPH